MKQQQSPTDGAQHHWQRVLMMILLVRFNVLVLLVTIAAAEASSSSSFTTSTPSVSRPSRLLNHTAKSFRCGGRSSTSKTGAIAVDGFENDISEQAKKKNNINRIWHTLKRKFVIAGPNLSVTLRDPFVETTRSIDPHVPNRFHVPASHAGPTIIHYNNNDEEYNTSDDDEDDEVDSEVSYIPSMDPVLKTIITSSRRWTKYFGLSSSSSSSSSSRRKSRIESLEVGPLMKHLDTHITLSIGSRERLCPNTLPIWESFRANAVYKYNRMKCCPSTISANFSFKTPATTFTPLSLLKRGVASKRITNSPNASSSIGNIDPTSLSQKRGASWKKLSWNMPALKGSIRPTMLDVKSNLSKIGFHLSTLSEYHMGWILFSNECSAGDSDNKSSSSSSISNNYESKLAKDLHTPTYHDDARKWGLKEITTSHTMDLPTWLVRSSGMKSVTVRPSYDFITTYPSCLLSSDTTSGRTAAILDLNWDNPTLRVEHAVDDHNIIAPELSLHTARILYRWNILLQNKSNIELRVDPIKAIHVTWTDRSTTGGGGKWITDFHLPLDFIDPNEPNGIRSSKKSGSTNGMDGLFRAINIKVRRQFSF